MQNKKPWHEDDSFWTTWGAYIFNEKRIADATEEVAKIVELLEMKPGVRVLDLGCGIGRITLEFARRGYQVTGVDRTAFYLEQARQQAEKENLKIECVHEDMRTFMRQNSFDYVVSTFTTFGYFEDQADDRRVVDNVCKSLKSGGAFLIDMHGKETLARIFQERDWSEKDGVISLQERKVTQNWSWMWNRWIMFNGKERTEYELSHRLYAGTEAQALLTAGGFSRADIYGSLEGTLYDQTARRLVAVGWK